MSPRSGDKTTKNVKLVKVDTDDHTAGIRYALQERLDCTRELQQVLFGDSDLLALRAVEFCYEALGDKSVVDLVDTGAEADDGSRVGDAASTGALTIHAEVRDITVRRTQPSVAHA
jgi:hypothetical protein